MNASPSLEGKVALVTGAARGIGRACALALAEAGADVALGFRDLAAAGDVAEGVAAFGRRVLPLAMDVTQLDQVRAAVAESVRVFGKIDVLVNNAGLGPPNPAESVTEADFDLTFAVNVKGTFFVARRWGAR